MSMTIDELGKAIGADVVGDGSASVTGCNGLDEADGGEVSFLANPKYAKSLATTRAGAVIVSASDAKAAPDDLTLLVSDDPYFAFRQALVALHGFRRHPPAGVSERAFVDPSATLGEECCVQAFAYVAADVHIGSRCVIYPHCYIGPGTVIGDDCILYPNVTIYDGCTVGRRVILHAGCVIGEDGYGFATHEGRHHKIPQIGTVEIADDVEIGANAAIERGAVGVTRIGEGSKIGELVAIGHATQVGRHNLLVPQVGLAGSVTTGDYVVMGGQTGVAGHLKIGDMVKLAAKSGVVSDLPPREDYAGQPARPISEAKRAILLASQLPRIVKEFRKLQKRVESLEQESISDVD